MQLSPEIVQLLAQYGPILFMAIVFYFMLYRPQKKEQKRRQDMLDSLKKGDRVVISSGILGTITALSETVLTIKISEKVDVEVLRSAVSGLQNQLKK